jgi:hypothetical protein
LDEALVMHKDEGYFLTVSDGDSDNGESGGDDDIMLTCHLLVSHPSGRNKIEH